MSGIDAGALSEATPGRPLAWNFASTGQSLLEAYLLSQEIPKSVDLVIYGLFIRPGPTEDALHPNKYNTLFMSGFRPNAVTMQTVKDLYSPDITSQLRQSRVSQIFSSRWALRQFIDTRSRVLLRPDLAIEKSTHDLLHPQSYQNPIDPGITARFIESRGKLFSKQPPALGAHTTELALRLIEQATRDGRKTMFMFPPIHPDLLRPHRSTILAVVRKFEKKLAGIPASHVVDATDLLQSEHFIDDLHPSNEGARILTEFLAQAIKNNR